jgi:hypothetical protein
MPSKSEVINTIKKSTHSEWDQMGDTYVFTPDVQITLRIEELTNHSYTNAVPDKHSPVRELRVVVEYNNQPIYKEKAYDSLDNPFVVVADPQQELTKQQAKFSSLLCKIMYQKLLSFDYLQRNGYSIIE